MHHEIESGSASERALHTVCGDIDIDDGGIDGGQGLVVYAECLGGIGAIVGDDAVGHLDDLLQRVFATRVFQVKRHALDAAVKGQKGAALVRCERLRHTPWVTRRRFDFDDIGAHVGEDLSGEGASDEVAELDHLYSF